MAPISTDVYVIPLLDRYLVYAPLRRVAFVASAPAVNLLHRLRQGQVEPASDEEAAFLRFCAQVRLTGEEGDHFDRAGFRYGLRLTVTAASMEQLPASVAYLLERARPEHIQVEPVYILGRGRDPALAVEPEGFVQAFLEAQALAGQCGVDFFYSAARPLPAVWP